MSSEFCADWQNRTDNNEGRVTLDFGGCKCNKPTSCFLDVAILFPFAVAFITSICCFMKFTPTRNRSPRTTQLPAPVTQSTASGVTINPRSAFVVRRVRDLSTRVGMVIDTLVYALPLSTRRWKFPRVINTRKTSTAAATTEMLFPRLPLELQNAVIIECDNMSNLLSYSLVCYAWVRASRRELTITVRSHKHAIKFCQILRSPWETFSPHIRRLVFATSNQGADGLVANRRVLRSLSLKGADIRSVVLDGNACLAGFLLKYYPHLPYLGHRFTLHMDSETNDLDKFLQAAPSFLHLRALSFDVEQPFATSPFLALKPILHTSSLRISGLWDTFLFTSLERSCRSLESFEFDISPVPKTEVNLVNLLMKFNQRTLSHVTLTIQFELNPRGKFSLSLYDPISNTNIRVRPLSIEELEICAPYSIGNFDEDSRIDYENFENVGCSGLRKVDCMHQSIYGTLRTVDDSHRRGRS